LTQKSLDLNHLPEIDAEVGAAVNRQSSVSMARINDATPSKSKQVMICDHKRKMATRTFGLLAVAITPSNGMVRAQDQQQQQRTPEGALSVNDLAGKPGDTWAKCS
jgi:hypothetical protein